MKHKSGFTLTEMLCVISIVLVLAALAWPALHRANFESKRTVAISNLKQLHLAMLAYRADNDGEGKYGTASTMGLPDMRDFYFKNRFSLLPDTEKFWVSPCAPHPRSSFSSPLRISVTYYATDDKEEAWAEYAIAEQDNSILLVDDECVDSNVNPWGIFGIKRLLGVRLSGSLERRSLTQRVPLGEWHP